MLLSKILFILLILICSVFYILYLWDFALVLLIVITALPAVMFITTLIAKHCIRADFALQTYSVGKNTNFPVQLCINNSSIFAIGKAEAHIEYYNLFSNSISSFDIYMPIQARNSQRMTFSLSSDYCGTIIIRTAYINIFDPLRIFRFRTCRNIQTQVTVTPEVHEIDGVIAENNFTDEESNIFSENKPGDDPSEVFGLREYIPGDKLNRIHWKLSSKKDELIVKEYSLPVDAPCTVFADLKCYDDSENTLKVFDALVETVISVSHFLVSSERLHRLVFFNAKLNTFTEKIITGFDELNSAAAELISSFNDNLSCGDPSAYLSENAAKPVSSFTYITSSADGRALSLISDEVFADIKNAIIILPSANARFTANGAGEDINLIPVYAGHISASIKEIEL